MSTNNQQNLQKRYELTIYVRAWAKICHFAPYNAVHLHNMAVQRGLTFPLEAGERALLIEVALLQGETVIASCAAYEDAERAVQTLRDAGYEIPEVRYVDTENVGLDQLDSRYCPFLASLIKSRRSRRQQLLVADDK